MEGGAGGTAPGIGAAGPFSRWECSFLFSLKWHKTSFLVLAQGDGTASLTRAADQCPHLRRPPRARGRQAGKLSELIASGRRPPASREAGGLRPDAINSDNFPAWRPRARGGLLRWGHWSAARVSEAVPSPWAKTRKEVLCHFKENKKEHSQREKGPAAPIPGAVPPAPPSTTAPPKVARRP